MDRGKVERWQVLVDSFGFERGGLQSWDADFIDANSGVLSHGEQLVVQFLLNVWSPGKQTF